MARYLITGGAGFIGSHLCDQLVDRGDDIVVIDNLSSGRLNNLEQIKSRINFIQGDLANGDLSRVRGDFDAVVHLAALISGHDSLKEPDNYVKENVNGLLRVIEFIADRKIPRVVFASSSTVYGNSRNENLSETDLPSPISVYASTKLSGEHLLAMYAAIHGFSHCSLRFFNVYGPRQGTDHPYANVTCKFSHAAANDLPITLYGTGTQSRDFVYVGDVVQSILLVLEQSPSVVYNIGTGSQTSIKEMIRYLEKIAGSSLRIFQRDAWPNDIQRIAANLSKARDEIGYAPSVQIADGLSRTVAFFKGE